MHVVNVRKLGLYNSRLTANNDDLQVKQDKKTQG